MQKDKKYKISYTFFIVFVLLVLRLFSFYQAFLGMADMTVQFLGEKLNMLFVLLFHIVKNDFLILALVFGLFGLKNKLDKKIYTKGINVFLFMIYIFYLFDVVYLQQNTRFFLKDLFKFIFNIPGWNYVALFGLGIGGFVGLFRFVDKKSFKIDPKWLYGFLAVSLIGYFLPFTQAQQKIEEQNLTENIFSVNFDLGYIEKPSNIEKKKNKYLDRFENKKGNDNQKNLIILNVESLSTIDSKRLGNVHNYMPLFDKIQEKGLAFNNFMANSYSTDGGLLALLRGYEPIPFSLKYDKFDLFNKPPSQSLPKFFNQMGYETFFVQGSSLDFLDKKKFFQNVGYQNIIGKKDFSKGETYTFNAYPDGKIYNKSLDMIESKLKSSDSFFMHILTISSHMPHNTPYGRKKETTYEYIDEKLYDFYQSLEKINYFDDGLLVIVGDHRKMYPLEKGEFQKYGFSSFGRVPLVLVGKGIPKGKINNNYFQHTDLFYSLKKYFGKSPKLIDNFNNVFTNNIERNFTVTPYFLERNKLIISNAIHQNLMLDLNGKKTKFNKQIDKDLKKKVLDYVNQLRSYQFLSQKDE